MLPEAAREAVQHATSAARETCHDMVAKAEETGVRAKEYVRQNPIPVVLGALALGVALGYLAVISRRHEQTLRERYVDDPLISARDAIYAALAPAAQRLHDGYDSAREGAGKAMDKLHRARSADSWSDQIGRIGSNLKFW